MILKTREQNRKNKRTEIQRFDWFIERIQTHMAFGWLANARVKKLHARELSRSQSMLHFDVILQHDWPIEQCLLYIRTFFGGKTKSPCFDLFIHWLIKQITNTYGNHYFKVIRKSLQAYLFNMTVSLFLFQRFFSPCLDSTRWQYGP